MKPTAGIALTYFVLGLLVAPLFGCSSGDSPTGPDLPGGSSSYDGTWEADFGPQDYPVRGLRFEVRGDAFVRAYLDTFWDLLQCPPPTFTDTRFGPVAIFNDRFTTPAPMVTLPLTIEVLSVSFLDPSTATGTLHVSLNAGGSCVATNLAVRPFTARKN
jgi:hypothetical protein